MQISSRGLEVSIGISVAERIALVLRLMDQPHVLTFVSISLSMKGK